MNARFLFAVGLILLCSNKLTAQWREVPIGALPMYYNGGFAGEAGVPRVSSFSFVENIFANAYNGMNGKFYGSGSFVSADHFLKRFSTGIGFTAGAESAVAYGTTRVTFASLAISPKISFKGKYTFAPFADIAYERAEVNLQNEYDPITPSLFVIKDVKLRGGFLLNSSRAYIGMTAMFANYRTDYSTWKEDWTTFANMSFKLQTGYTFQQTPDSKFSFTPQLLFSAFRVNDRYDHVNQKIIKRNIISLVDLNLMFRYDKWIAGINNAGLVLGYQTNKFKIQVANDYARGGRAAKMFELSEKTQFNLREGEHNAGHYTGSISLRYVFRKNQSPKMPGFNQ